MKKRYLLYIIGLLITFLMTSCSEDTIDAEGLGTIKGKVVMMGTNEPLANVKVSTNPNTSTVFTNEEGNYVLENVPEGDYSLSAEREDLLTEFEAVSVIVNSEVEIVFEMEISTVNNKPADAPILNSPADNATEIPITTELKWSGSDPDGDTLTYTLTIRNDEDSTVEVFENITDTLYTVSNLDYGTKYFWQVGASDGINAATNSATYAFETVVVPNNRIIFTRSIDGNNVIFSTDDAGNEIQLTPSDRNSFRPRRNPTVGKIAFLRTIGAETHLFTMNEDGMNEQQVTSSVPIAGFNLAEIDFSWDDNGAKLLYPNQDKLYNINIDGSGLTLVYQTTNGNLITEVDKNIATGKIALKTNDLDGYNVEIFTINNSGVTQDVILTGELGAAGGLNFSIGASTLLYTRDISGFENAGYRQLNTHIFLYNFNDNSTVDLSEEKTEGTNDLDVRFSPNEASIILMNTSNDGVSQQNLFIIEIDNIDNRTLFKENAAMPDWE